MVREFNGGWVDAVELMRPDARGFGEPAAITFGPGDFEQAHAVDEHIEIAEVAKAAEIYARGDPRAAGLRGTRERRGTTMRTTKDQVVANGKHSNGATARKNGSSAEAESGDSALARAFAAFARVGEKLEKARDVDELLRSIVHEVRELVGRRALLDPPAR